MAYIYEFVDKDLTVYDYFNYCNLNSSIIKEKSQSTTGAWTFIATIKGSVCPKFAPCIDPLLPCRGILCLKLSLGIPMTEPDGDIN